MIKPLIYSILAFIILLSICIHTKPTPEQHINEITSCIVDAFRNNDVLDTRIPDNTLRRIEDEHLVQIMLENMVYFDDYLLLSLGKVSVSNDEYLLSIGILGGVIVLPKKELPERIFIKLRERKIIE